MPKALQNSERIFHEPWQPGHVFGARPSPARKWTMLSIFVLLCAIIGAYLYITDANRVRQLAEKYLTGLIGGKVKIGSANLSIFEGLRLENVQIFVDDSDAPDAVLFSAQTFHLKYDPRVLLAGRLEATQILATNPRVRLTENIDTHTWNYQRRTHDEKKNNEPMSLPPQALPEILLRNAQVDYSEIRDGKYVSLGSIAIEGQFAPSGDKQRYTFEFQSRGISERVGPVITGSLSRASGQITAQLKDFEFGRDIRTMLPAEVRTWWEAHNLSGKVDVPLLSFTPTSAGEKSSFRVQTVLKDVKLTVRPEEWMTRDELMRQAWADDAFNAMRAGGLNNSGFVDHLEAMIDPLPLQMTDVSGAFVFSQDGEHDGIDVQDLKGRIEDNWINVNGRIEGFSPTAGGTLRVASLPNQPITIPAKPRYITSMPRQVRDIYDHLRPQGKCNLAVELVRSAGGKFDVLGGIDVVDGTFLFDRFPYPLRATTGKIVVDKNPETGEERLQLINLRGKGMVGGPNENSYVTIDGMVGPLSPQAHVAVVVEAKDISNEPALTAAFSPEVRDVLHSLDADGKGEYPKFRGSFKCNVVRVPANEGTWTIDTDIDLADASGAMVVFPYHMNNVIGKLQIREGYVDIIKATMKRAESSLVIDGRVAWRAGAGGAKLAPGETLNQTIPIRPELTVTARNVPIDKELLGALPPDRRSWLQRVGLGGIIDINGRVWREGGHASVDRSEIQQDFEITLRNGTLWPDGGTLAASNLTGKLHLNTDKMVLNELHGERGKGRVNAHGVVSWPQNRPTFDLAGDATDLTLDTSLYQLLPPGAQSAWDAVKPEGVVDLDMKFKGGAALADATSQPAQSTTRPGDPPPQLELTIKPKQLAATLEAVPYRMENIGGVVSVSGGKVFLNDLTATHGDSKIKLSGFGFTDRTDWDVKLSASGVKVDDEFRRALPGPVASLIDSMKLTGKVSFDFAKLAYRDNSPATSSATPSTTQLTTQPTVQLTTQSAEQLMGQPTTQLTRVTTKKKPATQQKSTADVDFACKIVTEGATMDIGVLTKDVNGAVVLNGEVRNGKLAGLTGEFAIPTLKIADREAKDFRGQLFKPASQDALHIREMRARLAGGAMSGEVALGFPDVGPQRYAINLNIRNADVKQIAADTEHDISGELSASIALEGNWSDITSRRGFGEVSVNGKEMYKIPLVLGLLQITNLSLPISSPFSTGTARYNVNGSVLTFERVEMRSKDMLMSGDGQIDFATKKVKMTFTTDNPNWPKLPIIGDIVQTAKHELLQIHVKGTIQEPKVSATAINTLTTTVDEVLRGDSKK